MREVMEHVTTSYRIFFGSGVYVVLFLWSIFFFFLKEQNRTRKKIFLGFAAVFAVIFVCPLSAYIIMTYCIETTTYWRMLWILPITVMEAYMLTTLIGDIKEKRSRYLAGAGVVLLLVFSGPSIYQNGNFVPRESKYKLKAQVVEICDQVKADAREQGMDDVGLIAANDLVTQIRQYDAGIRMPYGRNALRGDELKTRAGRIYEIMCADVPAARKLAKYAARGNYMYLAYPRNAFEEAIIAAGYVKVEDIGSYTLYRLEAK